MNFAQGALGTLSAHLTFSELQIKRDWPVLPAAIVGIAAFAALVTPNDLFSMFIMAAPVYALYEISIWLVAAIRKQRDAEDAAALAAG